MDERMLLRGVTGRVMGCTEPAAVAYAASLAAAVVRHRLPRFLGIDFDAESGGIGEAPQEIEALAVRTTRNLFKNAMAVGIPNTRGACGIHLAAALGPFLEPDDGLNLLKQTDDNALNRAREILGSGRVSIEVDDRDEVIFIEARVIGVHRGHRHVGEVVIRGRHDGLCSIRQNGRQIFHKDHDVESQSLNQALSELGKGDLKDALAWVETLPDSELERLLEGARINRLAADIGLSKKLGLGVGASLQAMEEKNFLGDSVVTRARILTAAAADARMSGYEAEIMASGGSGNQGIMATIPVSVLAEHLQTDSRRLGQALALGHLITAIMTQGAGLLGGMCGCVVKAGVGAAAASAMVLSDDPEAIEGAINNMAGNIVGEICDGAKVGCAMKLGTAAGAAVESALLACHGVSIPATNGIVGRRAFETLGFIGSLARGMQEVDRRIVDIMRSKT